MNDYVILTKGYCQNYRQMKFALEQIKKAVAKYDRLAETAADDAAREYYEKKAAYNRRNTEEIEELLTRIDEGLNTLPHGEQYVIRSLYIQHIKADLIQGTSTSSVFRIANKGIQRLAVCLFGAKAQLFGFRPDEVAYDTFSLYLINDGKWR